MGKQKKHKMIEATGFAEKKYNAKSTNLRCTYSEEFTQDTLMMP
jgi:hypothetical protein